MAKSSATTNKTKPKAKAAAEKPAAKRPRAADADHAPPKKPRTTKTKAAEAAPPDSARRAAPEVPAIAEVRPAPPRSEAPRSEAPRPETPRPDAPPREQRPAPQPPASAPSSSPAGTPGGAGNPGQPPRSLYQSRQPWQNRPSGGPGQHQPSHASSYSQTHGSGQHGSNLGAQHQPNAASGQGGPRPQSPSHSQGQSMNTPNQGSNAPSSSATMNPSQGGGNYYGNGNGGGQGMGGKKRRRKKKKGGGGGMPGMPGVSGPSHGGSGGGGGGGPSHHHVQALMRSGVLPMDEDLEREARELTEKYASPKEYAEACKKALVISELQKMSIEQLHKMADEEGVTDAHKYPRHELTFEVLKRRAATGGLMLAEGTLDIAPDGGYGFLRSPLFSYLPSPDDTYISAAQIRRMGLRKGMEIKGAVRAPKEGERFFALLRVDEVNGADPSRLRSLPIFEDLTPLHPEQRYVLETSPDEIEMRIVDLVAPIGRGQRGLIVAPPRTGKTVLLQKMTRAIAKNYPEVKLIVLLIDERPEEVTDFRRNTSPSVEVIASTFDEDSSRHVAVTEMVHEKSRRYVEFGQHVVILLDSITRLARAYNANMPHSGKIMTGGVDSNALQRPKKFFGNARAIENGGSLTILGTALVDTGSKADEVIFEEFKGTGNSELHLDRKLVDKRIWPAIDVAASGTRREELLLDPKELELTYRLRKVLADMNVVEAMELMKSRLKKCKTNAEFLMSMQMGA